jgi:hypothetical protein
MSKITFSHIYTLNNQNNKESVDIVPLHQPLILDQKIPYDKKIGPVIKEPNAVHLSKIQILYKEEAKKSETPNIPGPLYLKTPTQTFNHTHEYVIKDKFLWFRKIGSFKFKPLFFDGYPDAKPILVHADGANLFVVDEFNRHHYKKVLLEFRHDELDENHKEQIKKAGFNPNNYSYIAFDTNEEPNWQAEWFSLPVASTLVNTFKRDRLKMPPSFRAVAISHRGRFNDHVDDNIGQHHPVGTGVTTLYVLDQNGRDIHKYDPWSPPWAETVIGLKETSNTIFIANNISVSASTIMAIGFEVNHKTKTNTLKILTRLADIDTEGANPGLKYSFVYEAGQKDTRILPFDSDWQEHPLNLMEPAFVTQNISILQTGEGNNARVLRIEGQNQQGIWGYYQKKISQLDWSFFPYDFNMPHQEPIQPLIFDDFYSSVADYCGTYNGYPVELKNFGARSNHSQLIITIHDRPYILDIYKRFSMATFFGMEKYKYDLVNKNKSDELKQLLHNKDTMDVRIKLKDDELTIKLSKIELHHIKLTRKPT